MTTGSVLIVEDDENVRTLLNTVAKRYCSHVDLAVDGLEAIGLLKKHSYNVVLLDVMLPNVNGLEVAEIIRTLEPRPKVIVLSAIARYFKDHFSDDVIVLQKPFDLHRVEELLRTHSEYAPRAGRQQVSDR